MGTFWFKGSKPLKVTHFDAARGLGWRLGGHQFGCTPRPFGMFSITGNSNLTNRAPNLENCP
eukprot:1160382-Pelagomonas_calceolata.AAC.2